MSIWNWSAFDHLRLADDRIDFAGPESPSEPAMGLDDWLARHRDGEIPPDAKAPPEPVPDTDPFDFDPWVEAWLREIIGRGAEAAPSPAPGRTPVAPDIPDTPETVAAEPAAPAFAPEDFTGRGQTIVIIDDGYSPFYDQSSTIGAYDFSGLNDANASIRTLSSHGSWVAQTATDVAEGAEIIHLKVFRDDGGSASLFDIEEALGWVVEFGADYGVSVVNLSLGFGNATDPSLTMLSNEFAALASQGIFSVVAAGNGGEEYAEGVNVLAADPNTIAVSASDGAGTLAGFSQADAELTDIVADGVDQEIETRSGATTSVSGTSFAAPVVSGTAARLQEAALTLYGEPLTDNEFLEILRASGDPVTDPDAIPGSEPGAGMVEADADAALAYLLANADDYGTLLV